MLWILVQSDTVNDLILNGGHCDLYIMVNRFCLVSLTIFIRKTSYGSLKQTAGSTSCPQTTIQVFWMLVEGGGGGRAQPFIVVLLFYVRTTIQVFWMRGGGGGGGGAGGRDVSQHILLY